jgi:hypothetical protein
VPHRHGHCSGGRRRHPRLPSAREGRLQRWKRRKRLGTECDLWVFVRHADPLLCGTTEMRVQEDLKKGKRQMSDVTNWSSNYSRGVPPAKDYTVLAVIATVIGACTVFGLVTGIIAIIYSNTAKRLYRAGDERGGYKAQRTALILIVVTFALFVIIVGGNLIRSAT